MYIHSSYIYYNGIVNVVAPGRQAPSRQAHCTTLVNSTATKYVCMSEVYYYINAMSVLHMIGPTFFTTTLVCI